MIIDLDQFEAKDFEAIPSGTYPVEIHQLIEEGGKDERQSLYVELIIIDGEYAGRHLFDNLYFTNSAAWKPVRFCEALGFTSGKVDTEDLVGKKLKAKVTQREYEGKKRNEITGYLPLE